MVAGDPLEAPFRAVLKSIFRIQSNAASAINIHESPFESDKLLFDMLYMLAGFVLGAALCYMPLSPSFLAGRDTFRATISLISSCCWEL